MKPQLHSFSQAGQDLFVLSLFEEGYKGTFLDVGCGDPIEINNTYLLEQQGWKGLSIDIQYMHEKWLIMRKTPFICIDALKCYYQTLIQMFELGDTIDYLSLGIEGYGHRFQALERIMDQGLEFKVITIEHDVYAIREEIERTPQRELLTKLGYILYKADVEFGGKPFEDWWINPKYINI